MTKVVTVNRLLGLRAASVTLTLQLLWVHVESALKVIVLLPEIAHVVAEEQSHE
jgi:hypothetical protein